MEINNLTQPKSCDCEALYLNGGAHTSEEHKYELWDGMPFSPLNTYERDRLAICLIYSNGLKLFTKLLLEESKEDLLEILKGESNKCEQTL